MNRSGTSTIAPRVPATSYEYSRVNGRHTHNHAENTTNSQTQWKVNLYPHEFGLIEVDVLGGSGGVGQMAVYVVHVLRIVPDVRFVCHYFEVMISTRYDYQDDEVYAASYNAFHKLGEIRWIRKSLTCVQQ